jgi:hypothetical protein
VLLEKGSKPIDTKSKQTYQITYPYIKDAPEKPAFPSVRYFQVHFEHLESQQEKTRVDLEILQQQVADLSAQLAMLTAILNESKEGK